MSPALLLPLRVHVQLYGCIVWIACENRTRRDTLVVLRLDSNLYLNRLGIPISLISTVSVCMLIGMYCIVNVSYRV